jgi:hypothetical protein
MRPHTAICVSSYCYISVLILTTIYVSFWCEHLILLYMCPRTTTYVSPYCYTSVLFLLWMCPHTAIYVSSCYYYICVLILTTIWLGERLLILLYVSSYYYICVLILLYMCPHIILLYMCPHTAICVLILLYMCPHTNYYICVLILTTIYVCPHAGARAPPQCTSYCYICVLILPTIYVSSYYLLYMCPHTTCSICVSACRCESATSLAEYLLEESQVARCVSSY